MTGLVVKSGCDPRGASEPGDSRVRSSRPLHVHSLGKDNTWDRTGEGSKVARVLSGPATVVSRGVAKRERALL